MNSVIFRIINKEGDVAICIGNMDFYKAQLKTARQLLEVVGFRHTEQQRYELTEMSADELIAVLDMILESNPLKVEHPN